ncbi:MAG: DUF4160 domain-containing protein [Campylobacterales bacterium]|nr:DUF4160 domain-containing protein [Campylobacterales bacterium]
MPTIFKKDGWRFFFFSDEHLPKHVHVEKGERYLRIELNSLTVTDSFGVTQKEIAMIRAIIVQEQNRLLEAWDVYFKDHHR